MADKVEKPKKSKPKPKKDEKNVLGSLSSTRPERIGTRRAGAPAAKATAASSKTSTAKTGAPKAKTTAASGKAPTAGPKKAATARATATRRKAAAPRTFEPTEAAESAAGAADERAAGAVPRAETPPKREPRPRPVRAGAPGIGTSETTGTRPDQAGSARTGEQPTGESGRPSGAELVTTAVKAAGELTQVGLTIGGQLLKRAIDRLPRP